MNTQNMMQVVGKTTKHIGLVLRKHSPEIMIVAGSIGTVVAGIIACKATLEVEGILDDSKEKIDLIHETAESRPEEYPAEAAKSDLTKVYVRTGLAITKLYAPSVILGALSIGTIFASNNILRKRNASLAAAYTTLDSMFRTYRKNVVDEYGEDVDFRMRHSVKMQEIEETVIDEKGKEKKIKKKVAVVPGDPNTYSDYAKFFDAGSRNWDKSAEYNLSFLKATQAWANNKLKADGLLFLCDVYDALDIPRTAASMQVGWIYEPDNEDIDNYIDFGIYEMRRANQMFVNGYEPVILLDFNVDGPVLDKI